MITGEIILDVTIQLCGDEVKKEIPLNLFVYLLPITAISFLFRV